MESLFYFTRAVVSLDDIEVLARGAGYVTERHPDGSGGRLVVRPVDGDRWSSWYWDLLPEQDWVTNFEPDDLAVIAEYGPVTVMVIEEHPISWPRLRLLLASVLDRFGGWIGCDGGPGFDPVLTLDNIHIVDDPLYAQAIVLERGETESAC